MAPRMTRFTSPIRILGVEDNQVDQKILESMLTENPDYVSFLKITGSLKTAIELLTKFEFDVIMLDLNLPDSKGLDSLDAIHSKFPHLPVVVHTGAYEDDIGLRALSRGAQDFLIKGKSSSYGMNKVLHYAIERKRLEFELIDKTEKLTDAQSQLIQVEKMKVVGGIASGIAHEVKNPLATILYGVTFLAEKLTGKDKEIDKVIQTIKQAADKANSIIVDLLDFSSLKKLHKEKENLNNIIEKSLSLINYEIEQRNIKLIKDFMPDLPQIDVDRHRIEQVLVNVMLNAVYAMGVGGKLEVRTTKEKVSENPRHPVIKRNGFNLGDELVMVTVEDVGSGIPEDQMEKIFEPFFTTRRAQGGVGLGLSVSKNIVENHEGHIFLENKKEGGARATLVFKI